MALRLALTLAAVAVLFPVVTIAFVVRRPLPRHDPVASAGHAEPPAVVDLLTGGFVVEDDALPATIVDLAARGVLDLEPGREPGDPARMRRLDAGDGGGTDAEDVADFERRLLDRIATVSSADGWVTTEVLFGGCDVVPRRWWRGFVADVVAHAHGLGLVQRRWGLGALAVVWSSLIVGAACATVITVRWRAWSGGTDIDGSVGFVGMMTWAILVGLAAVGVALSRSAAQRPTPLGAEATAHWLAVRAGLSEHNEFAPGSVSAPSRELAWATALGLAPTVLRELPLETDHDRHVWSTASGAWRRVRVRYVSMRPHWGYAPWWAVLTGGLQAVAFGCIHVAAMLVADDHLDLIGSDPLGTADGELRGVRLLALLIAGVAAPAALFGLTSFVAGFVDIVSTRTVDGIVVARRNLSTGHRVPAVARWLLWSGRDLRSSPGRVRHHVAVDDGHRSLVLAHQVSTKAFRDIRVGARVRMRVTPLLGFVREVVEVEPPSGSDDALAHGLGDDAGSGDVRPPLGDDDLGRETHASAG